MKLSNRDVTRNKVIMQDATSHPFPIRQLKSNKAQRETR